MIKDNFPVPEGFKIIDQTENHIAHIGQGFYKRNDNGSLVMAFWIRSENSNSAGVAHGGMLMSVADYCLCSLAMDSKENYAATVSFRGEFIAPAKTGSILEIHPKIDKETKSLVFGQGQILCEDKVVFNFSGAVKKILKTS